MISQNDINDFLDGYQDQTMIIDSKYNYTYSDEYRAKDWLMDTKHIQEHVMEPLDLTWYGLGVYACLEDNKQWELYFEEHKKIICL